MIYDILQKHFNWTALMHAIFKDCEEIIELLLRKEGIDINIASIIKSKKFRILKSNFLMKLKKLNDLWNLTFNI